jgi:hypothetical protein
MLLGSWIGAVAGTGRRWIIRIGRLSKSSTELSVEMIFRVA